jgi:hypothetical protein
VDVKVGAGVSVIITVGVSLGVTVIVIGVTVKGSGVNVKGSDVPVPKIMIGVAVTIAGVRVGMAVHTGNGCGFTLKSMHAESNKANTMRARLFFIFRLLVCHIVSCPGLKK